VYPDPKHWWMLRKKHLKKILFWRKASRAQKYLQQHGRKLKFSQKRKLFAKIFARTTIFCKIENVRDKFRENENFRESVRIFPSFSFSRK
jgi:hypothetical protein